jgi:cytochrome c-type biogenesis protein CcsB
LNQIEIILYWIAILLYALSSVFFAVGFIFDKKNAQKGAAFLTLSGWFTHGIALLYRWQVAGHGPYMTPFEVYSSDIFVALTIALLFLWRFPKFLPLGTLLMPLTFLSLGANLMASKEMHQLPPTLRSIWLMIHIFFAKLVVGSILIASLLALTLIFYKEKDGWIKKLLDKLPGRETIDELSYKFVALAFTFLAIMIVAGAIWANNAWGRYWNWDPIETWSLITWLIYGLYLHLRLSRGWRGTKSAWLILLCLLISVFAFFLIPYVSATIHAEYLLQ